MRKFQLDRACCEGRSCARNFGVLAAHQALAAALLSELGALLRRLGLRKPFATLAMALLQLPP